MAVSSRRSWHILKQNLESPGFPTSKVEYDSGVLRVILVGNSSGSFRRCAMANTNMGRSRSQSPS
eukprot:1172483-Pleurochrysis_carterae.AAC.1